MDDREIFRDVFYSVTSKCMECKNLTDQGGGLCRAFPAPDGIPEDILDGTTQHDHPIDGDHGVMFDQA